MIERGGLAWVGQPGHGGALDRRGPCRGGVEPSQQAGRLAGRVAVNATATSPRAAKWRSRAAAAIGSAKVALLSTRTTAHDPIHVRIRSQRVRSGARASATSVTTDE
ncbi:MAG: hypothetical protein K6V97_14790 [Actinomycetia bacterium]|nr:hypothetical protein [Actinomycetes bacterium]